MSYLPALLGAVFGAAPKMPSRPHPVWTGRPRPSFKGAYRLHPIMKGKTLHAPDGYAFNHRGDLVSKRRFMRRLKEAA